MIFVARIDVRSVLDQEGCGLDSPREVQRRAAVAAARMHQSGIGRQHLCQLVDQPQSSSGVRRDSRSALDQEPSD